jgi:hypothetical protein
VEGATWWKSAREKMARMLRPKRWKVVEVGGVHVVVVEVEVEVVSCELVVANRKAAPRMYLLLRLQLTASTQSLGQELSHRKRSSWRRMGW